MNNKDKINMIAGGQIKEGLLEFKVGDTVKVFTKIPEGDKIRLHPFEGIVIARKCSGIHDTFIVRKVSFGEGIERVFPLNSPAIDRIEVLQKGDVKRSKLYYLRGKVGKKAKVKAANSDALNVVKSDEQKARIISV